MNTHRSGIVRLCAAWQALLVALAVVAPLIASGHPIVVSATGAGTIPASEYPLLRSLTRADWMILLFASASLPAAALARRRAPFAAPALTLLIFAGIAAIFWNVPPERPAVFDYAEREARGEIRALYTLVPFSPVERPGDRDARLLRPGTSHDEPLARLLRANLGPNQVVNSRSYPGLTERLERLPVGIAVRDRLRDRFADESRKASGLSGGEVEAIAAEVFRGSGRRHVLGTDRDGQDVLSRLVHGCRTAVLVGLLAAGLATAVGVALGMLMGYKGGWVDSLLSRVVEIVQSVPALFVLVLGTAVLPQSLATLIVLIAGFAWPAAARYTRAEFMRLRSAEFALAARASGLPASTIVLRHLLPNAAAPVLIDASFTISAAVVLEASLGFLGLGPPGRASWGALLASAAGDTGEFRWWLALAPGAALLLTALSYNIMGEALRDRLDPRTR